MESINYWEVFHLQIKEYLKSICEQIKYKPIREEISNEIEAHIIDLKQEYINDGIKEEDAEQKAINQMGNAEEIGKKLNQIHRPRVDFKLIFITIIYKNKPVSNKWK